MNIFLTGKKCEAPGCGKPATKVLLDRQKRKPIYCCAEHYELVNEAVKKLRRF